MSNLGINPVTGKLDLKGGSADLSGFVTGASSSVDNNIVIFDGITGKKIKDTGISSINPTFTGTVTAQNRVVAPIDGVGGKGFYFSNGKNACRTVGTASANFFFGESGNSTLTGIANTGVGQATLISLTTGLQNTSMGNGCLQANTVGSNNVAYGYNCLKSSVNTSSNTAIGYGVMSFATTATQSVGVGFLALEDNQGAGNTGLGYQAGQNVTTGANNVIIGLNSGTQILTGSGNVLIGQTAGNSYTLADSNNICIGTGTIGLLGESNCIRIGNTQTKCLIKGISGVTVTGTAVLCATDGQLGTIASSEKYKENIEDIPNDVSVLKLRPVKFNYKTDEDKTIQYGLIAEEVAKNFPYLCFYNEYDQPDSVKYHELCTFLLAEVQRLERRISALEKLP